MIQHYFDREHYSHAAAMHYCGQEDCRPGHSFGPATRNQYLFHYVFTGKGVYCVDDQRYCLQEGQGFLICPGQSTYYEADQDDPWHYGWFAFDGYEAAKILADCGLSEKQLIFTDHSDGALAEQLHRLLALYTRPQISHYAVLGQFYAIIATMQEPRTRQDSTFERTYADMAVDFIYRNFSYDIKIGDIAKHIGIDRTYLYKLFVRQNKLSPQQYLIQFRLNAACNLLCSTEMNITEIAYSCGFKDAPSFYKHFKAHYSRTPVEYRSARF